MRRSLLIIDGFAPEAPKLRTHFEERFAEPREAAADVASDVFVGLPDAVQHYREEGRAEWWLKQIAVRTALRRREALTGRWASGRQGASAVFPLALSTAF